MHYTSNPSPDPALERFGTTTDNYVPALLDNLDRIPDDTFLAAAVGYLDAWAMLRREHDSGPMVVLAERAERRSPSVMTASVLGHVRHRQANFASTEWELRDVGSPDQEARRRAESEAIFIGMLVPAREAYRNGLERQPTAAEAASLWCNIGRIDRFAGRFDDAVTALEQAIQLLDGFTHAENLLWATRWEQTADPIWEKRLHARLAENPKDFYVKLLIDVTKKRLAERRRGEI